MKGVPPGWAPATIVVRTIEEPDGRDREAFINAGAPGLAINLRDDLWVVSHVRSGVFIQPGFVKAKEAAAFALDLAPLTDWSRKARDLRDDEALRGAVVSMRDRLNFGRTIVSIDAAQASDAALDA
jgi:hypothetical protein